MYQWFLFFEDVVQTISALMNLKIKGMIKLQLSAKRKPMQVVDRLKTWDEFSLKCGVQINYRRYVLYIKHLKGIISL